MMHKSKKLVAGAKGLEPSTSAVTGQRPSNDFKPIPTLTAGRSRSKTHIPTLSRKVKNGPQTLTAAMAIALGAAIEHGGKLVRFTGYWSWAGNVGARRDDRFTVETIDALAARGQLTYTEHKDRHGARFPIVAQVVR